MTTATLTEIEALARIHRNHTDYDCRDDIRHRLHVALNSRRRTSPLATTMSLALNATITGTAIQGAPLA